MPPLDGPDYLFRQLLHQLQCDLVLDVGSRDGGSSLEMATLLTSAQFILFEAAPDNYERMKADPQLQRHDFTLEQTAVGREPGRVRFFIYRNPDKPDNVGLSSLLERRGLQPTRVVDVPVTTLDLYLDHGREPAGDEPAPTSRAVAMWIDVEGAAFEVLEGAADTLNRTALVFVELEEGPLFEGGRRRVEVVDWMGERGFTELAWGPHAGGENGDSLFVADEVLDSPAVQAGLTRWTRELRRNALRRSIYGVIERVPLLHWVWRRLKPLDRERP